MRPTSAYPKLMSGDTQLRQEVFSNGRTNRPSTSYTTRNKVLKSNASAYHTWLRRSNEFNYNVRNHPRDYNSVETFNLRSGCRVTKSASQLQVRLDPDEFFEPKAPKPIETHIPIKDMEILIEHLREQVNYLTVYLEEEKLHHDGTKKRAKVDLEKSKAEMEKHHGAEIERILGNHVEFIEELKKEHAQQMEELDDELKRQYKKLEREYKMLQASFKNYKTKITEEMDEKWEGKKRDFQWEKQRAVDNAVEGSKRAMEEKFNKERVSIRNEYKELMQQMLADQRKEMEDFMRKMSDGKSSIEELKARADQADKLEIELKETTERLHAAKMDIKRISHEQNETRAKLSMYENRFEEKVGAVEDKYRKRIDDLVHEVSDFRVMLIRKAETLYEERAAADELQRKWTQFAKKKLEERLFPKSTTSTFVTSSPENDTPTDIQDISGAGDSCKSPERPKPTLETANGLIVVMEGGTPDEKTTKSYSVPPKKHPARRKEDQMEEPKDTNLTKAGKDKIRPRLPLTTISLLDTVDLPYVDGGQVDGSRGPFPISRPQSPDVIY